MAFAFVPEAHSPTTGDGAGSDDGDWPTDGVASPAASPADAASAAAAAGDEGSPATPLPPRKHFFGEDRHIFAEFETPPWLVDASLFAKIAPPKSVKTLAGRLTELDASQRAALAELKALATTDPKYKATIGADNHDDGTPGGGAGPPLADEWRLLRYLGARGFHARKAADMLHASLLWERQLRPAAVQCTRCARDPNAHCMEFVGWDVKHRPVMYATYAWSDPATRNNADEAIEHNVALFQRVKALMPEGVEQWVVLTDFVTYSLWRDATSKVGRVVMDVLQNHFPERLGAQVLVDPPAAFWVMYKAVAPFIDERTKAKLVFAYTDATPSVDEVFAAMFPPHLAAYLVRHYRRNKATGGRKA